MNMFPKSALLDYKEKEIEVYVKNLPNPHCIQIGILKNITEHLIVLNDSEFKDRMITIPIENIIMIKEIIS